VSSRCPHLRGPRFFSIMWSCLAFVWLLITCLSFSVISFLFIFSLNWLLVCVVNALIKGGDWGLERPRTGGWSLLAVMSD
jgi:hypothetical protein